MRIAYITAGAAGMYCGSCMHDNTLAATLQALGQDCVLVPTYTPVRTDEPDVSLRRVFFSGLGIYLEQNYPKLRKMPGFLRRWLGSPSLLRAISRISLSVRPEELGELTVSMLKGLEGNQRQDVLELVGWLCDEFRPDVVVLTNILIAALTPVLKKRLPIPVVCTLQGDDIYLDWLPEKHRQECFALIRNLVPHLDGYLTTSNYYADFMTGYLGLPRERIAVVYPGLNLTGFDDVAADSPRSSNPVTIGYLARICPEKGLHNLFDAFGRLVTRSGLPPLRLKVAGYCGQRDKPYLKELQHRAAKEGWGDRLEVVGEVTHPQKVAFLQSLDIFSVPTTYREPKGLYLLEAWACGVPAVQPRHGSFPELIERTRGGLLFPPGDTEALADSLERLVRDRELRRRLGESGRTEVRRFFHARRMAEETLAVLQHFVTGRRVSAASSAASP
ncbi:MAG: glycosyltransferase family 4 protein [Gemmatales bacterium]|nr:glycosyltransferase family 4 protein [Gemmatales bacterium]MDW8386769.1 glycosyltransferase family 4 protein [Gemmatales bacterium]